MFEEFGYNLFLIKRYLDIFGRENTRKFLEANKKKLPKAIRVNTLRTDVSTCIKRLEEKGFVFSKIKWCDYGYIVREEPFSIGATPEYLLGMYYIQDATSMVPAIELSPAKNETVLDMTAAPGGKTTHLSQIMENTGVIVAVDMNKEKMRALRSNIQRTGSENVFALRMRAEEITSLGLKFDKILLDAPCTGEGTIRKNPDRRKTINEKEIKRYAEKQKELIKTANKVLKPGGILVYSTCSLSPEENEMQVEFAVEKLGFKILNLKNKFCLKGISKIFGKKHKDYLSNCGRFYPHIHNTQGFFVAKLKKT